MLRSDHRGLKNRDLKLMWLVVVVLVRGGWWVYRAKAITASAQPTAHCLLLTSALVNISGYIILNCIESKIQI